MRRSVTIIGLMTDEHGNYLGELEIGVTPGRQRVTVGLPGAPPMVFEPDQVHTIIGALVQAQITCRRPRR